jgi:putative transcriptional regulator
MRMAGTRFLTNQFLIAMPSLADPNFFHSVTYICEHNENGAMGIVINRPLEIDLGVVLDHMNLKSPDESVGRQTVFLGGPVECERGFVLHEPLDDWDSTMPITESIGITSSRDILQAICAGRGPRHALVALGYAGWGGGQLEQEMVDNAWLSGPADSDIMFSVPVEDRWHAAARMAGVDLNKLSDDIGHA